MDSDTDDEFAISPFWRLADSVTVVQAAALIGGVEPECIYCDAFPDGSGSYVSAKFGKPCPKGVLVAFAAIKNAIINKRLIAAVRFDATPRYLAGIDSYKQALSGKEYDLAEDQSGEEYVIEPLPNWDKTTIDCEDLKTWLAGRGFREGFFFPDESPSEDYLNPNHPRYAPKLAAAVIAWKSVEEHDGRSVKQAIEKWVRENATTFGLTDDDGRQNEKGIEEVTKVANWNPLGGAAKTPNK